MNFRISLLLLVGSWCYVSAESGASGVASPREKDGVLRKNAPHPTEDDGIWIKNQEHVLKADPGSKDAPTTPQEPPAPSTAPPPTPVPDQKGNWMVNYTSTSTCIRLVSELKVQVGYIKGNEIGETQVVVPKKAVAKGNCTAGTMVLSWPSSEPKKNNSIHFWFTLDNATHFWTAHNISGSVIVPVKNGSKTHQNVPLYFYDNTTCIFGAHQGMSYLCLKSDSYEMAVDHTAEKGISFTSANLTFFQMQLEAFKPNVTDNAVFGSPNNCEITPDMVPIAVGCALAGLIVIVLVAYLIAQRKPPNQGYRSV